MPVIYVDGNDVKRHGLASALNAGHHGHHMRSILDDDNAVGTRVHVPVYGGKTVDVEITSYIKKPRRAAYGESGVFAVSPVNAKKGKTSLPEQLALKVYGDVEPGSTAYALTYFMQAAILRILGNAFSNGSRHPNVLPYYGDFYDKNTEIAAFALGLVPSQTTVLSAINGRHYTFKAAVKLGSTIFRTVDELGKHQIIHRDIKPQNILQPATLDGSRIVSVDPDDIMFFDFDVGYSAKYAEQDGMEKPAAGLVLGTPGYMPPEMWRGENTLTDIKGDVYSAAVTVLEAVTGQRAWRYDNFQHLLFVTGIAARNYQMPNNIAVLDSVIAPYGNPGKHVKEALLGGLNPDPEKRLTARLIANLFDAAYAKLDDRPAERKDNSISYSGDRMPTICMDADAARTVLMQR